MARFGRAAVEVLLWLGVMAGLSLLALYAEVRPGASPDVDTSSGLDSRAIFGGSFMLVSATTALVLWIRTELPLARVASAVAGLALLIASGPWSDVEDAGYLGWTLRVAGVLLWVCTVIPPLWAPPGARTPLPRPALVAAALVLVVLAGYGLAAVGAGIGQGLLGVDDDGEPGWSFAAPGFGVLAIALPSLRGVLGHLLGPRRDEVAGVTGNGP